MNLETKIQNEIILAINQRGHRLWRTNAGKAFSKTGAVIKLMPQGFPDTVGFRKNDGKMIFIEVKTPTGKLSKSQKEFKAFIETQPVIYGIARSVDEAIAIVEGNT